MSGRKAKKIRRIRKAAQQAVTEDVRRLLRIQTARNAADERWRWLRGFTWEGLRDRVRDLTAVELLRFFTSRCLFCGRRFLKKSFGHDCHAEVCMFAMMERVVARRRARA